MTEERIHEVVAEAIQKYVNGKIDKIATTLGDHIEKEDSFHVEIRQHMEEVRPFLQGAKGLKLVRDFFVWIGGLFIVYVAFKNSLKL